MTNFEEPVCNPLGQQKACRKRVRSCRRRPFYYSPGILVLLIASTMNAIVNPANAFQLAASHFRPQRISTLLYAVRSPDTLQPVKPKSSSSRKKREKAMKAMERGKVESALDGVDAQMLELLSDQFLYPSRESSSKQPTTRPRGRPDFVPGAMKYETMMKYREGVVQQQRSVQMKNSAQNLEQVEPVEEQSGVEKTSRKKSGRVKGAGISNERQTPTNPTSSEGTVKKRKRVVKNLPEPRDPSKPSSDGRKMSKGRSKANNLELQKYYRTELLTADEEYSLGVKIQLMVKCEQVHEGLALEYLRLPTVEEWAAACG